MTKPTPVQVVETIHNPDSYSPRQIGLALLVAYNLNRGTFVLTIAPES